MPLWRALGDSVHQAIAAQGPFSKTAHESASVSCNWDVRGLRSQELGFLARKIGTAASDLRAVSGRGKM